jgi:dTDP-4-dehydrorhamnose 3,5-epimerase
MTANEFPLTGHVTPEWLREQNFELSRELIDGVIVKELKPIVDGRGAVIELWSKPWASEGFVDLEHSYVSLTDVGVSKGWHLHEVHIDQFAIYHGKVQVVVVDTRIGSPTFGRVNSFIAGTNQARLIKIPNGLMHGWKALSAPRVHVINYQSKVYDPTDEIKFDWETVLEDVWEPKNG